MGIRVELPIRRRKGAASMQEETESFTAVGIGWDGQLGADDQQSLHMDYTPSLLKYRPSPVQTTGNALASSPESGKHLISSHSGRGGGFNSSDPSSPLSYTGICLKSPTRNQGCGGGQRQMNKRNDDQGLNPLRFACSGQRPEDTWRHSRWGSGRWSPGTDLGGRSGRSNKKSACQCAAGLTGDVAAVCCCPLSLLHLLALALIKLPSVAIAKGINRIRRKINMKRKRSAVHEEDDESVAAPSFPPSRSRSYEAGEIQVWAPSSGFGDPRLWKDYFGSPEVWGSDELVRTKS